MSESIGFVLEGVASAGEEEGAGDTLASWSSGNLGICYKRPQCPLREAGMGEECRETG